jgi:hypothetical protein
VPLLSVNQRLIENFQNVAFDLIEAEAADVSENAADEGLTLRVCHYPVEEIALRGAEDASGFEGCSRQHVAGIVITKTKHGQRDRLGDDHQKRVLEEQRVAFYLAAVDQLQELRPELSFQGDRRIVL